MNPMHNEKEKAPLDDIAYDSNGSKDAVEFDEAAPPASGGLARELKGRHMQMIAIGTHSLNRRFGHHCVRQIG